MCQASASSLCVLFSLRPRRCRRPWMRRGLKRPSSSEAGEGLEGLVLGSCLLSGATADSEWLAHGHPPTRGRAHLQRWRSETFLLGRASCRRDRARQRPRSRQAVCMRPAGLAGPAGRWGDGGTQHTEGTWEGGGGNYRRQQRGRPGVARSTGPAGLLPVVPVATLPAPLRSCRDHTG